MMWTGTDVHKNTFEPVTMDKAHGRFFFLCSKTPVCPFWALIAVSNREAFSSSLQPKEFRFLLVQVTRKITAIHSSRPVLCTSCCRWDFHYRWAGDESAGAWSMNSGLQWYRSAAVLQLLVQDNMIPEVVRVFRLARSLTFKRAQKEPEEIFQRLKTNRLTCCLSKKHDGRKKQDRKSACPSMTM